MTGQMYMVLGWYVIALMFTIFSLVSWWVDGDRIVSVLMLVISVAAFLMGLMGTALLLAGELK